MKLSITTTLVLLLSTAVDSRAVNKRDNTDLSGNVETSAHSAPAPLIHDLEKRRGGGGGGGGGRGGGSSGGSSGGRTGSGGSSSSGGGSSGGSSGSRGSSSSNTGGSSRGGSGRQPAYGGGTYYAGGATAPYSAGRRTPGGLTPYILPAAALAFLPGVLLFGAYAYPYHNHYNYVDDQSHQNKSLPVVCVCQEYAECGCDDNNNSTYYQSLFNGTQPANSSNVRVVDVNGTEKIYINGTLPNGTTAAESGASTLTLGRSMAQNSGYWAMVAVVVGAVWM